VEQDTSDIILGCRERTNFIFTYRSSSTSFLTPLFFAIQSHSTFLKEEEFNKNLEKYKETISQHEKKFENFYEQVKQLKDAIMERTKESDKIRKELAETQKNCDERIENILKEVNMNCSRRVILNLIFRYCNH
jgi:septal ring factor EnvC (AmiA/AmiB activator)